MKSKFLKSLLERPFESAKARAKINLGEGAPSNIIIKLAETKDEIEQAFQVLHDAYVDESWMDPQASGLRMTKYHALPMTAVLVAIDLTKNRVVGTISIIRDSELGLPLDAVFPLTAVKEKYPKLAEISSLAIQKNYRKDAAQVFWPLIRSVIRFAKDVMRVDAYVIGVHPTRHNLYTSIMGFKKLKNSQTKDYGFVKNAPVAAYMADLRQQEAWCKKIYSKLPQNKNWYQYCYSTQLPVEQHRFFETRYSPVQKPVMTPELFEYFFQIKTDSLQTLADQEKAHVKMQYSPQSLRISALNGVIPMERNRRSQRFHARISGKLYIENLKAAGSQETALSFISNDLDEHPLLPNFFLRRAFARLKSPKSVQQGQDISIISFSQNGIGIHCSSILPDSFYIRANLGMKDRTWLKLKVKNRQNGFYGCEIVSADENWLEFIKIMNNQPSPPQPTLQDISDKSVSL